MQTLHPARPSNLRGSLTSLLFCAVVLSTSLASAQTTLHLYRGGEDDTGSVAGDVHAGLLVDAAGNTNLAAAFGQYTSSTPGPASTLAYGFNQNNSNGAFAGGQTNLSLTNTSSFAMELWFKATSLFFNQALFHNGRIGIYIFEGQVAIHRAGIALDNIGAAQQDVWTHVAFAYDDGTLTGFLNGTQVNIGTELSFFNPITGFELLLALSPSSSDQFRGDIDHARIFSFAPGTFNASMLSYPASAIPEPATFTALAGLAALGLAATRRRRAA